MQLKPQDIIIVTKLLVWQKAKWSFQTLGESLGVGHNQVHLAYKRLIQCDLVNPEFKRPIKQNLVEFFTHGIHYVFPPIWQEDSTGIPTAASGPLLKDKLRTGQSVVWPAKNFKGAVKGKGLTPIHESVIVACRNDRQCYEILSVIEALRCGGAREREAASEIIKDLILGK